MPVTRWWVCAMALLCLGAGAAVGAVGAIRWMGSTRDSALLDDYERRMGHRFNLDALQQQQLRRILTAWRGAQADIHSEHVSQTAPRLAEEARRFGWMVRQILTPAQRARYDAALEGPMGLR